jgi:Di-haem oxidoreductase, putative peroxidase
MSNTRQALARLIVASLAALLGSCVYTTGQAAEGPVDPGVRGGSPGAGGPLPGLSADELAFFNDGLTRFVTVESVSGGQNNGLGARFNSNSCLSCHEQPTVGGSSPTSNPLIAVATLNGAKNTVPWFITAKGPIREARFKRSPEGAEDGSVHDLFVITGRSDAGKCNIAQPDFLPAGDPLSGRGGNPNIIFRIPTPVFGAGLIEAIPDTAILANMAADTQRKKPLGVSGHPNAHLGGNVNRSANDGTITRFGWKAQNKSLLMFAGEAYNVEMGISNELFPTATEEDPGCQGPDKPEPNDVVRTQTNDVGPPPNQSFTNPLHILPDWMQFQLLMRFMDAPQPDPNPSASAQRGRTVFSTIGCSLCHTPQMQTAPVMNSEVLENRPVNLFSDLLVHHMGIVLADNIIQGQAGPDEFRTTPLWGVGQRLFFLHDGRTSDLLQAILAHFSSATPASTTSTSGSSTSGIPASIVTPAYPASEANAVITQFKALSKNDQQAILDFLRSL